MAAPLKVAVDFPRFSKLPAELRIKIWLYAMPGTPRALRLAIIHCKRLIPHYCVLMGGHFCGHHSRCPQYSEELLPRYDISMIDGFFCVAEYNEDPEDAVSRSLLQSLGSACHESRELITRVYPETIRVYDSVDSNFVGYSKWDPSRLRSRHVRCNPATDVLVIANVPHFSVNDTGGVADTMTYALFPQDRDAFRYFRNIISSFQHVALDHIGSRVEHDEGYEDPEDLINTADAVFLLYWFESLRQLSLWPNPGWWPDVLVGDRVLVNETGVLRPEYIEFETQFDEPSKRYRWGAGIQNAHGAAHEHYWVPHPKPLPPTLGCYASTTWLKKTDPRYSSPPRTNQR